MAPKPWDDDQPNGLPPVQGEPLLLSASGTIAPNTGGTIPTLALANPDHKPMLLDELRFQVTLGGRACGGVVKCSLKLGEIPLTGGFIPLWGFGKAEDLLQERFVAAGTVNAGVAEYVWRLSRPLFIPGNLALVPQFFASPYLGRPVSVKVSFVGRQLPAMTTPRILEIPYIASYESKQFVLGDGSVQTDSSAEDQLLNPFNVPLQIERFVGRYMHFNPEIVIQGATGVVEEIFDLVGVDTMDALLAIRMTNSLGDPIVRINTPFRAVFDPLTRSWEIPHEMAPLAYYKAYLTTGGPVMDTGYTSTQFGIAQISMVGYRDFDTKGAA